MELRMRSATRAAELARRNAERASATALRNAERQAAHIERQVRARVERRSAQQVRRRDRLNRGRIYSAPVLARRSAENAAPSGRSAATPIRAATTTGANDDYEQHCEVRDSTMPAGPLNVDAGQNGGIVGRGLGSQRDPRPRHRADARRAKPARARELAGQVQVQAGGGRVYATGPENMRREWWSVSYRINVPRKNDLDLRASNGGITIIGVTGNMRFDTTNGGVSCRTSAAASTARPATAASTSRSAAIRWDGEGLDVETSNGGVDAGDSRRLQRGARDPHRQRRPAHRLPDHGAGRADVATRPHDDARLRRPAGARADDQRRRQDRPPLEQSER